MNSACFPLIIVLNLVLPIVNFSSSVTEQGIITGKCRRGYYSLQWVTRVFNHDVIENLLLARLQAYMQILYVNTTNTALHECTNPG